MQPDLQRGDYSSKATSTSARIQDVKRIKPLHTPVPLQIYRSSLELANKGSLCQTEGSSMAGACFIP